MERRESSEPVPEGLAMVRSGQARVPTAEDVRLYPPKDPNQGKVRTVDLYYYQVKVLGGVPIICSDCPVEVCPTCRQELRPRKLGHCETCQDRRWLVLLHDDAGQSMIEDTARLLQGHMDRGEVPWLLKEAGG